MASLIGISGFILYSQKNVLWYLHCFSGPAAVSIIKAAIHFPELLRPDGIHSTVETGLGDSDASSQVRAKALTQYHALSTVADRIEKDHVGGVTWNTPVIVLHNQNIAGYTGGIKHRRCQSDLIDVSTM